MLFLFYCKPFDPVSFIYSPWWYNNLQFMLSKCFSCFIMKKNIPRSTPPSKVQTFQTSPSAIAVQIQVWMTLPTMLPFRDFILNFFNHSPWHRWAQFAIFYLQVSGLQSPVIHYQSQRIPNERHTYNLAFHVLVHLNCWLTVGKRCALYYRNQVTYKKREWIIIKIYKRKRC